MKRILFIFCLVFVLFLNIYFRSFPIYFPQLKERAKINIEKNIYEKARKEIEKRFPTIYPSVKETLIKAFILEYKEKNKESIKNEIQKEYLKLKEPYQDKNSHTYLMELDCWHWARYVELILEKGYPADVIKDGKLIDKFMLYPSGSLVIWNRFLFYLSAFLYKIFSFFRPIPLFYFLFFLPLFFVSIFILILYILSARYFGIFSAIVLCLFVGLAPIFLLRSCAGWFDTDILNLLFTFLVIWTYIKAVSVSNLKKGILWVIFSSFLLVLFCFNWVSWWFVFLVISIYEIIFLLNGISIHLQYKIKTEKLIKKHIIYFTLFLIFSFLGIFVFIGSTPLVNFTSQVFQAIFLNKPLTSSIWPNVYSTVGELRKPNLLEIINNSSGGWINFFLSLLSLLLLFLYFSYGHTSLEDFNYNLVLVCVVLTIGGLFASLKGNRFIMFLVLPLGLSLAIFLNKFNNFFNYIKVKKKKIILFFCYLIFTVSLVILPINRAGILAKNIFPLMDDNWYDLLFSLKEKTPYNSVINSWWDFGDWFKVISKRAVIIDGQSQNTPQTYWMARVLLANNEEEAIKILRMLNNGGNLAFEILNKNLKDPFKSIFVLNKVLKLDEKEAEKFLLNYLPLNSTKEVLNLIFSSPKHKAYFLVDYTLISKMHAISFIGNWDFLKVYILRNYRKKNFFENLETLDIEKNNLENFLKELELLNPKEREMWLSKVLKFYAYLLNGDKRDNLVFFKNGIVFDIEKEKLYIYNEIDSKFHQPKDFFIYKDKKLLYNFNPEGDLEYAVLVIPENNKPKLILADTPLMRSLFLKLYFLNIDDLKHFKPFIEKKHNGDYIKVFEIIW